MMAPSWAARPIAPSYQSAQPFVGFSSCQDWYLIAFVCDFGVESNCPVTDWFMRSISKQIALFCVLLTFWSAVAFVSHHHSSTADALKCTVCVAAHSPSPKATSTLPDREFVRISTFRSQQVSAKQRLVAFALSVRPPPAV
jgi:hypothetical protein